MRAAACLLCLALVVPAVSIAQEAESSKANTAGPLQTYMVEIAEVELSAEVAAGVDRKQILQSLELLMQNNQVERHEQVRLSVLAHHESTAHFAKQIPVTQGVTMTREGRMRNTTWMRVGTMVQVSAEPHGEAVFLKLKYEASRLGKEISEDDSPDSNTVTVQSDLLVRPGKRVVAATLSTKGATYLLVSIVE